MFFIKYNSSLLNYLNNIFNSIVYGIEYKKILILNNYFNDVKILKSFNKNDNIHYIISSFLLGDYKKIIIDNNHYIIFKKYFYNKKSELINSLFNKNKNIYNFQLNINDKNIIDFIIQFLLLYDINDIFLLNIDYNNHISFSYNSLFIDRNIINIYKNNKIDLFYILIYFFKIKEFYSLYKFLN